MHSFPTPKELREKLNTFLLKVKRPSFYTGGEISGFKPAENRFCFCFPDSYDVGMSNIALKILTALIDSIPCWSSERTFLPFPDMEAEMIENNVPLYSLETFTPLRNFDFIGFTLQFELCYTNVLAVLELSGIPLKSSDRTDSKYPIIIGGGPCAVNPEPIADFFDLFVIGEAEEVLPEILCLYEKFKERPHSEFFIEASQISGVYVPSLYSISYNKDGTVKEVFPKHKNVPEKIKRAVIKNIDSVFFPEKFIVPLTEIVQDRAVSEVLRGCVRGCRFCQAGFIYRPFREKSSETVVKQAAALCGNTGYDELSLASLSTSDHTDIENLLIKLTDYTDTERISLSLPSMRIDKFSGIILDRLKSIRKSGLTFAPEAGTQRLRDVINKNIAEDEILNGCRTAFSGGYSDVKLYFMLGLPTETDDDIEGIFYLAQTINDIYYEGEHRKKSRPPSVSISVSTFVPKPFTPFQYEPQLSGEEISRRQQLLLELCRKNRKIKLSYSDFNSSSLEAVLARGDRHLSEVILSAYKKGCKFDSWSEHFKPLEWKNAFLENEINPEFYANRKRGYDEVFPWSHIDILVNSSYFISENKLAHEEKTTGNCFEKCSGCGIINNLGSGICPVSDNIKNNKKTFSDLPEKSENHERTKLTPAQIGENFVPIRVFFSKTGMAKYISHLDLYRTVGRALKAARLPVYETQGFNPHIYISFDLPLPLGIEGLRESFEIKLPPDYNLSDIPERLNRNLPEGISVLKAVLRTVKHTEITHAEYRIKGQFPRLNEFLAQDSIKVVKTTKKSETEIDLKPLLRSAEYSDGFLYAVLPSSQAFNIGVHLFLTAYYDFTGLLEVERNILRTRIFAGEREWFKL